MVPLVFTLHMSKPSSTADFGESAFDYLLFQLYVKQCAFAILPFLFFVLLLLTGFAVTGHIDGQKNSRIFVSEVLPDGLAFREGT